MNTELAKLTGVTEQIPAKTINRYCYKEDKGVQFEITKEGDIA